MRILLKTAELLPRSCTYQGIASAVPQAQNYSRLRPLPDAAAKEMRVSANS